MHRLFLSLILAFATLVAGATTYSPETVPVSTQFRDRLDFNAVSNPDGIIAPALVDSLNEILWTLREHHDVQGLVVAIKEADFDDPYRFAIEIGRKHGVGGKNANGFIVFLATESHGYYILTGEGFEKYLTDAQCSKIGRLKMVPYFKQGRWGDGILAGVSTIASICEGETELSSLSNLASDNEDDSDDALLVIFFFVVIIFFIITIALAIRPKCPGCGKHHYRMTRRRVVKIAGSTKKVIVTDYYTCRDCGYSSEKQYESTTDRFRTGEFDGSAPYHWGEIITATTAAGTHYYGSDYGGGHSSYGGGSGFNSTFGGGSFGGGGAGGHF